MSHWEHSRFRIFNFAQHPLVHQVGDLAYTNQALPAGVTSLEDVLNYIVSVIYPNYIATVATTGDLPLSANPNEYYFVTDDGDGKSAGYVWQVIDGAGKWFKRYDVDWSFDGILAETLNRTAYMYYHKYGMTDRDDTGTPLAGDDAGQHLYGGDQTGQNLTLHANSADATGVIRFDDSAAPTANATKDFGTTLLRWAGGFFTNLTVTTLIHSDDDITADGDITATGTMGASNLSGTNTGDVTLATVGVVPNANGATLTGQVLNLEPADETNPGVVTTGAQSFAGLKTFTGGIAGSSIDLTGDVDADGDITAVGDVTGANLSGTNTGDVTLGAVGAVPNANGATLTGQVLNLEPADATNPGVVTITAQTFAGEKTFSDQAHFTNVVGDSAVFSGGVSIAGLVTFSAGTAGFFYGTTTFDVDDFFTLHATAWRDAAKTLPAQAGDSLFFDGTQWLASPPDTEITHSTLSGLTTGDAGHTQFAVLAGRAGGQTLQGDTAASGNLTLESTSNLTKGSIFFKDTLSPYTNASYSGGWQGTDLGDSTHYLKDMYSKGIHYGLRVASYIAGNLPAANVQNLGNIVFQSDVQRLLVDVAGSWVSFYSGDMSQMVRFTYANAAARTGAVGLTSSDVGKVAFQTDTGAYWVLTDESPVTWELLGNKRPIAQKTSGYSVSETEDYILEGDASGGDFAFTLPSAANCKGRELTFVNTGASGVVTLTGTVSGVANPTLDVQYDRMTIYSNGTAWIQK